MNTVIFLTVIIGAIAYVSAVTCGRMFASAFALLAAASVPVIYFR